MQLTREQALEETMGLWNELADKAALHIAADKLEIDGPWFEYEHQCPCCEFVKNSSVGMEKFRPDCLRLCPMSRQWKYYIKEGVERGSSLCTAPDSPYEFWSRAVELAEHNGTLFYDLEFFCRLIAELAHEALMDCLGRDS